MIRSAALQTSTAVARQGTRRCGLHVSSNGVAEARYVTSVSGTTEFAGRRRRRRLSSLSAHPQDSGPGLLQSNALAAQYLGSDTTNTNNNNNNNSLDPLSSLQPSSGDLLRHGPAHSEALTKLVRTLLHAPSAAIDSSVAVDLQQQETTADQGTNTAAEQPSAQVGGEIDATHEETNTFVSDGWEELDETPLQQEDASLAAEDAAVAGDDDSSSWWEETALLQDQEEKHTKRHLLRRAERAQNTLFSMCSPKESDDGKGYQPRIHVEPAMEKFRLLVQAEQDDHPTLKDFAIDPELYPKMIIAMPKRFLIPKIEILRQYVAAVEARAMKEQQQSLDEDSGGDGSGEVGLVLDLDSRALYNCCESPGTYAQRLRKRGTADIDANASIVDSICFLGDTLINTPVETQHYCLPRLMASALNVRSESNAWTYAADIFWHMDQERFPIDYKIYNHILCNSTFRSTPHFPFWKVLKVLSHDVEARKKVDMCDVIQLLLNHFPYTDATATKSVMRSMLSLHQPEPIENLSDDDEKEVDEENAATETISFPSFDADLSFPLNCNTHADRGVLQAIAYAGAAAGDPDMVLMAWDLADQAGYSPSAEMYESIVTAFSRAMMQDHNAFAALCEMEEAEVPVSRALVESFSTQVGYTPGRIKNARFILTNGTEGTAITTASLNIIMAALAGRGDTEGSFETFALFKQYDVEPNADTYSYMIESLASNMTAGPNNGREDPSPEDFSRNVTAAQEVLKEARDADISSGDILHQYLRTLCAADYLEEATAALKEAVGREERILMESFSLVAIRHAKEGLFETAKYISEELYPSAGYGKVPRNVIGRIKNMQKYPNRRKERVSHEDT